MCLDNTADRCEGKYIKDVRRWVWVGCQEIHLHRWLRRNQIAKRCDIKNHPDLDSLYRDLNVVFRGDVMKQWFEPKTLDKLQKLFKKLVDKEVLVVVNGKFHWPSWTRQWLSSAWNGDISPPLAVVAAPPASSTGSGRQRTNRRIYIPSDKDSDDEVSVVTSRQTSRAAHSVPPTTPAANNWASTTHVHESQPRRSTRETTRAAATLLSAEPTHQPVSHHHPPPLTEAALRKKTQDLIASLYGQPMTPPTSPPSIQSLGGVAEEIGINSVRFPDYDHENYYQTMTPTKVSNNRGSAASNIPGSPRPRTRLSTTQTPEPRYRAASARQRSDYSPSPNRPRTVFDQQTPYSPAISHLSEVASAVPSSIEDEEWEQLLDDYDPSWYDCGFPVWDNITIRLSKRWNNQHPSFGELVKMTESVGFIVQRNNV